MATPAYSLSGGIDYESHPAAASQRDEADKRLGLVCGGKGMNGVGGGNGRTSPSTVVDEDVIEIIEVGCFGGAIGVPWMSQDSDRVV